MIYFIKKLLGKTLVQDRVMHAVALKINAAQIQCSAEIKKLKEERTSAKWNKLNELFDFLENISKDFSAIRKNYKKSKVEVADKYANEILSKII